MPVLMALPVLLSVFVFVRPELCSGAVVFSGDQTQTSLVFSLPADQSASEDLPLDEPPLVRPLRLAAGCCACLDRLLAR